MYIRMDPNEESLELNVEQDSRNSIDTSYKTTSNPPAPQTSYSMFGDDFCGEPLLPQHLVIDFSPIEKLDNDFIQRKCCAFWELIQSHPEIWNMMALPSTNVYDNTSTSNDNIQQKKPDDKKKMTVLEHKETTALSMLEFIGRKGLIACTFDAKLPQCSCSLGSIEYEKNPSAVDKLDHQIKNIIVCDCNGICELCKKSVPYITTHYLPEVKALCEQMNSWDEEHPKSCDPPKHPAALNP